MFCLAGPLIGAAQERRRQLPKLRTRVRFSSPAREGSHTPCGAVVRTKRGRPARSTGAPGAANTQGVNEVVALEQVGRTFRCGDSSIAALADISLSIAAGTFVAIMG